MGFDSLFISTCRLMERKCEGASISGSCKYGFEGLCMASKSDLLRRKLLLQPLRYSTNTVESQKLLGNEINEIFIDDYIEESQK